MASATITVKPAAGPETERGEPLNEPTTNPPTMPAIMPEKRGALLARAIPKHSGSATRKTTKPAEKSEARASLKVTFVLVLGDLPPSSGRIRESALKPIRGKGEFV